MACQHGVYSRSSLRSAKASPGRKEFKLTHYPEIAEKDFMRFVWMAGDLRQVALTPRPRISVISYLRASAILCVK
jgi:hypothetical protein